MFCKRYAAKRDENVRSLPARGRRGAGLAAALFTAAAMLAAGFFPGGPAVPASVPADYGQSEETAFDKLVCTDQYLFFRDVRTATAFDDRTGEAKEGLVCRSDLDGGNVAQLTDGACSQLYCHEGELYYLGYANGYSGERWRTDNGVAASGLIWLARDGSAARMIYDGMYKAAFDGGQAFFALPNQTDGIHCAALESVTDHELAPPLALGDTKNMFLEDMLAWNGWVYVRMCDFYTDSYWLARVSEADGRVEHLADMSAKMLRQSDGAIFFTVDGALWQMAPDGSAARQVLAADIAEYEVLDGYVYFREKDRPGLWRTPVAGGERTQLTAALCADFCLGDGTVYYADMYDHGSIWAMDLTGTKEPRRLVAADVQSENAVTHDTAGVDDYVKPGEKYIGTVTATDQPVRFDDSEFERFLGVMFGKTPGTVTGADLASVKFFGYYEGTNGVTSELRYVGQYDYLAENCVYFSTEDVPELDTSGMLDIMFYDEAYAGNETAHAYGQRCQKMTVESNEWLCRHVLPYLCCFPNLQRPVFGYCWVTRNICLPGGELYDGTYEVNTHLRYG